MGAKKSDKLAADLHDERMHFNSEVLQNAESTLGIHGELYGSRKFAITEYPIRLLLSHFGKPFY